MPTACNNSIFSHFHLPLCPNVTTQYIVLYCGGSKIIFLQIRDNSTCSASLATAPPVSADPAHVKTVRNLPLFMTVYEQICLGNF